MSRTHAYRIPGLLTKRVDLLPDEEVIRGEWATYLTRINGYTSRLYLTNQRVIFTPLRMELMPIWGPLYFPRAVISCVGEATVKIRLVQWQYTWYIESGGKKYYFGCNNSKRVAWPIQICEVLDVPFGEPRALYS
jgi:hypothetical protein